MNVGIIVVLFLGIVVGLALLPEIFNNQATLTDKTDIADEVHELTYNSSGSVNVSVTYTMDNAPSGWQATNCPLESITVTNASGTALTVTTDYTLDTTTGVLTMVANDDTNISNFASGGANNNSLVDYTYCQDGYIPDGSGRSMAALIGLFAALVLVSFTIYHLYRSSNF